MAKEGFIRPEDGRLQWGRGDLRKVECINVLVEGGGAGNSGLEVERAGSRDVGGRAVGAGGKVVMKRWKVPQALEMADSMVGV